MIINHTHRFIFVHVPKAAGTSMVKALSEFSTYQDQEIGGTQVGEAIAPFMRARFGLYKHAPAAQIAQTMGDPAYRSYFSFCMVRNPYARLQSTYYFLKHWRQYPTAFAEEFDKVSSFEDFLLSDIWVNISGPDRIFLPQTTWINDSKTGLPLVRYVGKIEDLETVLKTLSNAIFGLDGHIEMGTSNVTPKYESLKKWPKEAVTKIKTFYATDFVQLGYDQDPPKA